MSFFPLWNTQNLKKHFSIYNLPKNLALSLIYFYRYTLSYFLGGKCRFYPSCSEYALDCYKEHNFLKASWFTLIRLSKCHPFSGSHGYDPIPTKDKGNI